MANLKVTAAITAIQDVMHDKCSDLTPQDYMDVLESIGADIDGCIDALKEENPEEFE